MGEFEEKGDASWTQYYAICRQHHGYTIMPALQNIITAANNLSCTQSCQMSSILCQMYTISQHHATSCTQLQANCIQYVSCTQYHVISYTQLHANCTQYHVPHNFMLDVHNIRCTQCHANCKLYHTNSTSKGCEIKNQSFQKFKLAFEWERLVLEGCPSQGLVSPWGPVSYTHLTLPTNREV